MAFLDLPLEQLQTYTPQRSEPADFDAFWSKTLAETRQHPLDARFELVDNGLSQVHVYDVTFNGFAGHPVKGWFVRPATAQGQLPCVVEFIGYGGGRGLSHQHLLWASAGYAHFVMDTRGQGSTWTPGDTPDPGLGANPAHPGYMTQGILDPLTYYYRRVFTDGVRALEAARSRADVDSTRIAVIGGSQGGGISIAAAALDGNVALCMPDVPFLCHFRLAVGKTDSHPYQEIVNYLKVHRHNVERVFSTLDYFDNLNFAPRLRASSLFSVGLMDDICPPSTIYAAYNYVTAPKQMKVYAYNNHEGGGGFNQQEQIRFVKAAWG